MQFGVPEKLGGVIVRAELRPEQVVHGVSSRSRLLANALPFVMPSSTTAAAADSPATAHSNGPFASIDGKGNRYLCAFTSTAPKPLARLQASDSGRQVRSAGGRVGEPSNDVLERRKRPVSRKPEV